MEPPYGGSTLKAVGNHPVVELALDDDGETTTKNGREGGEATAVADALAVAVGADAPTAVSADDQYEPLGFFEAIAVLEQLQDEHYHHPARGWALESWQADPERFVGAVDQFRDQYEAGKIERPLGVLTQALTTYLYPGGDGRQWDVDGEPAS